MSKKEKTSPAAESGPAVPVKPDKAIIYPFLILYLLSMLPMMLIKDAKLGWIPLASSVLILTIFILWKNGSIPPAPAMFAATLLALVPQFYLRCTYKIYIELYSKLGTYVGDLWYAWDHYLSKNFPYPREYPAGMQILFTGFFRLKHHGLKFEGYMILISLLLGLLGAATTYMLFRIKTDKNDKNFSSIWLFWILAPSMLWCGLLNVDLITVFIMVLAFYFFIEGDYYLSAGLLALGAAVKVFPIFLFPLFFFKCPKKIRWKFTGFLILAWVIFNLPSMLKNFNGWLFPYQWQAQSNYAKTWEDGSYFWIVNQFLIALQEKLHAMIPQDTFLRNIYNTLIPLPKHIGKISLLMFGGFYWYFCSKKWHLSMERLCVGIMLLFILTDRVYSPQYHLYLLPFLAIAGYNFVKPSQKVAFTAAFLIAETLNIIQLIFIFKIRTIFWTIPGIPYLDSHPFPWIFQGLVAVKYLMIGFLFIMNWNIGEKKEKPEEKDNNSTDAVVVAAS
ncbi:MAG: glycosyltransferase 87 family protein [Firmicutes bacterium]|nr:glycosyltransferase 87 family protein [Bacillota bacterium]